MSQDKEKSESADKSEADNEKLDENAKLSFIKNLGGLTVLLRCNRTEDLMMHITGKNLSTDLIDKIKELFETGPGKDCNVKSLYCKSITKYVNKCLIVIH